MNKVLHFEQTMSMSDVDDGAETEAFDTSGSSSSSDELEPDTTTRKLLEDFLIVEEESDSKPKNVFSDNQVAIFVLFLSVAKLSLRVVQCFTNWFTNWVYIQLNIVSFCLVLSLSLSFLFSFHFHFSFLTCS